MALRRFQRGPGKPGRSFRPTARDTASLAAAAAGTPAAGSYWGPLFPPVAMSYWGALFPSGPVVAAGIVPPVGVAGAATFAPLLESGSQVTYQWSTDSSKSHSGLERRAAILDSPKQTYSAAAVLIDDAMLSIRGELAAQAATGAAFLLALPYEEITISSDSSSTNVPVRSTAECDWAVPGQRVVIFAVDGETTFEGSVQYADATSFTLDTAPGSAGLAGGRIMPAVPIYLDPQQAFARYPTTAERWQIMGRHARFDYGEVGTIHSWVTGTAYAVGDRITSNGVAYVATTAGTSGTAPSGTGNAISDGTIVWRSFATLDADGYVPTMGVGATVSEYLSKPIWNRGIDTNGTADDSMQSMVELVDLGGIPLSAYEVSVPDWGRRIAIEDSIGSEWQWLKAFLYTIKGSCESFWLPTHRPDLLAIGNGPGGTSEVGTLVIDATVGDFTTWYPTQRSHIMITQASGTTYAEITASEDLGDGTLSLTIQVDPGESLPTATAVTSISWLELCRLEGDDVTVQFSSATFSTAMTARVIQPTSDLVHEPYVEVNCMCIIFGNGADGALAFDGVSTVLGMVPATSTSDYGYLGIGRAGKYYTLTRNIYATNITISTAVSLIGPYQIYATGTIDLQGTAKICDNGSGGFQDGQTNPGATRAAGWYPINIAGGAGGNISNGTGGGASGAYIGVPYGASLSASLAGVAGGIGQGGGGGTGVTYTGGTGGAVTAKSAPNMGPMTPMGRPLSEGYFGTGTGSTLSMGSGGGGGGGGNTPTFAKGGGGGASGGFMYVAGRYIQGTGSIEAKGGKGSAGAPNLGSGNSGSGGGGGPGGVLVVVYETLTDTTLSVAGGAGGAAGASTGSGTAGAAGGAGGSGILFAFPIT